MKLDEDARRHAKAEAHARIDDATLRFERGDIDEAAWSKHVTDALAAAYLLDDDPRWQSGFDGDAELWRQARELILDPVVTDGSFLDIGCANGHLMECLAAWALERRRRLSIFGLELNPGLAAEARRRIPVWAERIFEGNARTWQPPMRFTYVHTRLEYVPEGRGSSFAQRLLRDLVEAGGRLIAGPVTDSELAATVATLSAAGYGEPTVASAADRNAKTRHVLWIECPTALRVEHT